MVDLLKVVVIGSTGYAGSHVCIELLARGHTVTGVTRSPDKIGRHPRYIPHPLDLEKAAVEDLIEAFTGHEVVIKYVAQI